MKTSILPLAASTVAEKRVNTAEEPKAAARERAQAAPGSTVVKGKEGAAHEFKAAEHIQPALASTAAESKESAAHESKSVEGKRIQPRGYRLLRKEIPFGIALHDQSVEFFSQLVCVTQLAKDTNALQDMGYTLKDIGYNLKDMGCILKDVANNFNFPLLDAAKMREIVCRARALRAKEEAQKEGGEEKAPPAKRRRKTDNRPNYLYR